MSTHPLHPDNLKSDKEQQAECWNEALITGVTCGVIGTSISSGMVLAANRYSPKFAKMPFAPIKAVLIVSVGLLSYQINSERQQLRCGRRHKDELVRASRWKPEQKEKTQTKSNQKFQF